MAKSSTLHQYARIGAAAHIKELRAQIAEIQRAFPGLDGDAPSSRRRPGRPAKATADIAPAAAPRKKRTLSAAARKAISDAQKKRWAKVKKAKSA